ncbi:putative thioredoxin protein [Erysiphe necator]|uniref:Putative thioredoxin protein n=1 Tax=Uncinula necator TaxID=52586 RepID=A0A0B1PF35_UNCNE|nr:putative thioredoxin protein [Erysiphe necator]
MLISSPEEFQSILHTSQILVAYFYADWCELCKRIAPVYDELSLVLSIRNQVTFVKVNIETHIEIASEYAIASSSVPTIIVLKYTEQIERISGVDIEEVKTVVGRITSESESLVIPNKPGVSSSIRSSWPIANIPRGFNDITEEVDLKGLDLLNANNEFGSAQVLFDNQKPSGLKDDINSSVDIKDWVQSDTDEQLMLYIPFRSVLKIHSLQVTSAPPKSSLDQRQVEVTMRPKIIQIFSNRANILGFEEAEQIMATQTITLNESDWDDRGTATLILRMVKFQNVSSLVLYIVDGVIDEQSSNSSCRTRLDRIRIIGDSGEKRDQGVLERYKD